MRSDILKGIGLRDFLLIFSLIVVVTGTAQNTGMKGKQKIAIAIHGGASNLKADSTFTKEKEELYRQGLSAAIDSGYAILKNGGSSTDAVVAAVKCLEDNPLFNAGKGAVFSHEGKNEMDAAIMNGKTLDCGAVAGVRRIKNPIATARKIMDSSQFIFLAAEGAEKFAQLHHEELVDTSYFFTQFRWDQLQKLKNKDTTHLDNDSRGYLFPVDETKIEKFGTVGCVAIDANGNLAAATSTGGVVNKRYNRVGDSPIIGAGTYANNKTCAVSCTGKGEDFIRLVAAKDISDIVEYQKFPLSRAVNKVIMQKLKAIGGRGGCIAIDKHGTIVTSYTTTAMFRATIDKRGIKKIQIF